MYNNELEVEQRRIGLELHQAETAIGVGRRAICELMLSEPVDDAVLATQRTQILESRLARNALRHQLAAVKRKQDPLLSLPRSSWIMGG